MKVIIKTEDESFLEEKKNRRVVKEIQELFNTENIMNALVFHFKKSQHAPCKTSFHTELEAGFAKITVTDPELNNVLVEMLSQDDWLDSIEREKTTANIGKWVDT